MIDNFSTAGEIVLRWISQDVTDDMVTFLVPLGKQPLPEPMLTKVYL